MELKIDQQDLGKGFFLRVLDFSTVKLRQQRRQKDRSFGKALN